MTFCLFFLLVDYAEWFALLCWLLLIFYADEGVQHLWGISEYRQKAHLIFELNHYSPSSPIISCIGVFLELSKVLSPKPARIWNCNLATTSRKHVPSEAASGPFLGPGSPVCQFFSEYILT